MDYTVRIELVQVHESGIERVISRHEGTDHPDADSADEVYVATLAALLEADAD